MKAVFGEIEAEQRVEGAKKLLKKPPTLQIREHLVNVWFCSCNVVTPGVGLYVYTLVACMRLSEGHQPLGQTTPLHTCTRTIYRAR